MKITVTYSAQARDAAGTTSETVELGAGATVKELVAAVTGKHGESLEKIMDHPSIILVVGDEQVAGDRALRDGESVTVLSPISGG